MVSDDVILLFSNIIVSCFYFVGMVLVVVFEYMNLFVDFCNLVGWCVVIKGGGVLEVVICNGDILVILFIYDDECDVFVVVFYGDVDVVIGFDMLVLLLL